MIFFSKGGGLLPGCETPSAETLVGWLLEHQNLQVHEDSDTDYSLYSMELASDESGSMSDIFDDFDDMDAEEVRKFFTFFLFFFFLAY